MLKITLKLLNRTFLFIPILLLILVFTNYKYKLLTYVNYIIPNEKLTRTFNNISSKENYDRKEYPPSVILWTSWRSGSTFLGELLHQAHQDTFYDYEPMWPYGVKIFRYNSKETETARNYLNSILRCDMNTHKQTSLKLSSLAFYRRKNNFMGAKCKKLTTDCKNTTVLSGICKTANYHVIKLLRLGLVWADSLLSDPSLDIKIVYLVRDPRPIIRSRLSLPWCGKIKGDCSDPAKVCHHILQDLTDARKLRAAYPDKFHFIRYEDLSLDVLGTVENLWNQLNFNLTNEQREQIKELTTDNGKTKMVYRVNRNSAAHTFSWRTKMDYELMKPVQDKCTKVLDILGLRSFQNKEDYMNYSIPVFTKTAEDIAGWVG